VTSVYSQAQYCSSEEICIAVNVPLAQIASGNPDLLLTLQAPSSSKWFATGFGSQMAGTLMLVAWPYNQEVIVSSRLGQYPPTLTFLSNN
jgi:Cytochrome domain of cellobiose dehydrogenase